MDVKVEQLSPYLDDVDEALIAAVQCGLPLVSRPYAEIGRLTGLEEQEVIDRLTNLKQNGAIKRLGIVVRHHELGYRANAMVVWNMPDERVSELGRCIGRFRFVTLCYRRPRRLPDWPYSLFTMIHGRDEDSVRDNIKLLIGQCGLQDIEYDILFSRRRFKQRGARYCREGKVASGSTGKSAHAE